MKIYFSSRFRKSYKKLPTELKARAKKKEEVFRRDIFDPKLKTHKLRGKFKEYWSFSVSGSYRIMFDLVGEGEVVFIDVGDHDIYN
ncbi:MAG: type II toxin-antitoxin system mRNA interferase toxin, RelE/StbE family [bacterium]|nr:type II toxin-antitoxin system mRNA interferase toxin, RelE/StbE family [bacterium]